MIPDAEHALARIASLADLRGRPAELLPAFLAELREACGADGLAFARREEEALLFLAGSGSFSTVAGHRSAVGASLGGWALQRRTVALAQDALNDERVDRALCLRGDAGALLAVPVEIASVPTGVFVAGWRVANAAATPAVDRLRTGAGLFAAAIARTLHADLGGDAASLLAAAFSQASHGEAEQRPHEDLDVLTRLLNRPAFETALATSAAGWSPGQGSAVLFLDLDRFHRVNESHGHAAGDAVLQRVAEVLRRCTRGHDVVSRLGDDDFAVLLNRLSNPELQAAVAAERIVDAVLADNLINEAMPRIELCIGASLIDRAGLSASRVMQDAESALHAEKSERR